MIISLNTAEITVAARTKKRLTALAAESARLNGKLMGIAEVALANAGVPDGAAVLSVDWEGGTIEVQGATGPAPVKDEVQA